MPLHRIQYGVQTLIPTALISSDTGLILTNPTLEAGDVTISKDFGAVGNIGTLPSVAPALSGQVKITISAAESQCLRGQIRFKDQTSPSEWDEVVEEFYTEGHVSSAIPSVAATIAAGAIANDAITAASIAADAITNAKIADDAIAVENIKDAAISDAKFAATGAVANFIKANTLVVEATVSNADFAPTTTQFEVTGLTDTTINAYKDCYIKVQDGANKYEIKPITASSVVVTNVRLTVGTLSAALANGVKILVF